MRREVKAAINSRWPGVSGEGPRITSWVKRDRCSVADGLKAIRCMICGTGIPPARSWLIVSA